MILLFPRLNKVVVKHNFVSEDIERVEHSVDVAHSLTVFLSLFLYLYPSYLLTFAFELPLTLIRLVKMSWTRPTNAIKLVNVR